MSVYSKPASGHGNVFQDEIRAIQQDEQQPATFNPLYSSPAATKDRLCPTMRSCLPTTFTFSQFNPTTAGGDTSLMLRRVYSLGVIVLRTASSVLLSFNLLRYHMLVSFILEIIFGVIGFICIIWILHLLVNVQGHRKVIGARIGQKQMDVFLLGMFVIHIGLVVLSVFSVGRIAGSSTWYLLWIIMWITAWISTWPEEVYLENELGRLEIISNGASPGKFSLLRPEKKISLRQLLTHSSGVGYSGHALLEEWKNLTGGYPSINDASGIKPFTAPLLFGPGEGWSYGASIEWTVILLARLTKKPLPQYIDENIFGPLDMNSSTFAPQGRKDISSNMLQMVRGQGTELLSVEGMISAPILEKDTARLLFAPQFSVSSKARYSLRHDTENYAAPARL
ncbi:hypothetical protein BT63DRAFT_455614 [Microthyrium microscopicum]|uniref:Beta-lactamase-related domain-containing protein n=1 Tax=Microthyrium microscopicum TaxID=703497 RepID=A0A6A6UBX3_9PEZI|nr:hypothetical protein BT63DRAFT_455614 [Microthyrium microscopicum]